MPKPGLKQRVRETWRKLSRLDAPPGKIAAGFAIGIAAGFLPLNPSPIIVATAVAWLLNRKVSAAIAGATVALLYTPLLPLIWLVEYRLGQAVLQMRHPAMSGPVRASDMLRMGWDAYAAMGVGSIIIAGPVALFSYFVVKWLAEKWARQRDKS